METHHHTRSRQNGSQKEDCQFFNVQVGATLSGLHDQETSVPQASILSVTFLKINDDIKCLNPGIDYFMSRIS